MKIEEVFLCILTFLLVCSVTIAVESRRLGKLETQTWENHAKLGQNSSPFEYSEPFPDFSSVGALISKDGILGTASLIAPDVIITAAHVLKNKTIDPLPSPKEWEFILHHDFDNAPNYSRYDVESFIIHPDWIKRQQEKPPWGDGDSKGVDIALVKLTNSVQGYFPYSLPGRSSLSVGEKIFVAGYGSLIEGDTGSVNPRNSRRMAGENILDRVAIEINVDGSIEQSGGVLAFDFDSPQQNSNRLGNGYPNFDYLPSGMSDPKPLSFEISTAEGDSGAPLLAFQDNKWKIFGTVSYGSSDSSYGDITVLTRLQNHLTWILPHLPAIPTARMSNNSGWRESKWFGFFRSYFEEWHFHSQFGWFWSNSKEDQSVWLYVSHLGWLWTSVEAFPCIYSDHENTWFYLDIEKTKSTFWRIYNYSILGWQNRDIK